MCDKTTFPYFEVLTSGRRRRDAQEWTAFPEEIQVLLRVAFAAQDRDGVRFDEDGWERMIYLHPEDTEALVAIRGEYHWAEGRVVGSQRNTTVGEGNPRPVRIKEQE